MNTTFSYFPGMFENKLEAKCYLKKNKIKIYYEKSTTYKCGER